MKILLTGRNGQVGWELERALAPLGEIVATDRSTLDLSDPDAIRRVVREVKPEIIVNAAAYTAVDKAESEPELAMRINGFAPGVLAEEAKRLGALLVHYSTDYVFDGEKVAPYVEEDTTNPINVYGKSKLGGEKAIQASTCRHLILRTSWVYGPRGHNFLLSILRAARERPQLRVVADQVGAPTSSDSIARTSARLLRLQARGNVALDRCTLHVSARGETSWYAFAETILEREKIGTAVVPISAKEYSSAARRPKNSLLSNDKLRTITGEVLPDWSDDLDAVLTALREAQAHRSQR